MTRRHIIILIITSVIVTLAETTWNAVFSGTSLAGYGWILLSNLLLTGALMLYVSRSALSGARLALSTFVIAFGIGSFNIMIEAIIFNVTDVPETIGGLLHGFFKFSVLCGCLLFFYHVPHRNKQHAYVSRSIGTWTGRILLCVLLYIVVYVAAGIILQQTLPELMEFYAGKIPPFGLIILVQVIRGFIFSAVAILFLRTHSSTHIVKAAILGILFSILGGIAPLIPVNEYMPLVIRIGHGFEVGISNFAYGFLVGLILNQRPLSKVVSGKSNEEIDRVSSSSAIF